MITVSDAWKDRNFRFLLPETFLELSVGVTDVGIQDIVTPVGVNEAPISNTSAVVTNSEADLLPRYATLEHNLWELSGDRTIAPDSAPYNTTGYVSNDTSESKVVLNLSEVRNVAIPGFTITWSSEFDEYPVEFAVTVKNGNTVVASTYVNDNNTSVSEVALDVSEYDSVTIETYKWCLPQHRARIDLVSFGHVLTYTKKDILSFTHEQYGDLNSGEISKNSITFSINNIDGKWNPNNPSGFEKYLSERQIVNVRYGLDIDGKTEWIKAGTFYLSEWRAPANGLEASFSARDIFEYLLNETYTGVKSGTLMELVTDALEAAGTIEPVLHQSLSQYTATLTEDYTAAEVVQMCANAAGCLLFQDREGHLHIEPLNHSFSGYVITSALSYAHPEMELLKPMKSVSVSYGEDLNYVLQTGNSGETQTVDNPLINTESQAQTIARWVRDMLEMRKMVSGEYRADPRLDLFDIVSVQSKYGAITPVVITNITYSYTGSFRATYKGRVIPSKNDTAVLGNFILGVSVLGEVT